MKTYAVKLILFLITFGVIKEEQATPVYVNFKTKFLYKI